MAQSIGINLFLSNTDDASAVNYIPKNLVLKSNSEIEKITRSNKPRRIPANWKDFKTLDEDVEKCEYEYELKYESDRPMKRQLGDVFTGTLQALNLLESLNPRFYPHLVSLPRPPKKELGSH